ncbi:MAG: extracellular solute-binding protein [Candidatus Enteromonas sp.]
MKKRNIVALTAHILLLCGIIVPFGIVRLMEDVPGEAKEKFNGQLEHDVVLRILENDTAKEQGYLDELINAFNAAYAAYGIVAKDANMDQYTDLETGGPYGYGPDVLYQANDAIMKYVSGRHILPLPISEFECYEQTSENAWNAYRHRVNEQPFYFGVPVNIQQPLLFYRKDLLPENWKLENDVNHNDIPDMIETWSGLYQYSKKIVKDSNGTKYGYMKSLNDGYFASGYFFSYGGYVFGGEDHDDVFDIGFSKNDSALGGQVIRTLASTMNLDCTEDTITRASYSRMASGDYFATMTTPDVRSLFVKELKNQYVKEGLSESEALIKAEENIVMCDLPLLPESGDLNDTDGPFKKMTVMGGVNGYAISSYTKAPNAALEFVKFATSYQMIKKRTEMLSISPARQEVSIEAGGLNNLIYQNLEEGSIYVMPSVRELSQVWTPLQTFCAQLADDVLQSKGRYETLETIQAGLEKVDQQIYDAIHTLSA